MDEAYQLAGYKPNRGNAARLNANESVQARIAEIQRAAAERVELSVAGVLMELWRIATADPRELVEHRIGACRYCWGEAHRYQETPRERERRYAEWVRTALRADDNAPVEPFDELGGLGFNATRAANPACPECFGEGEGRAIVKDTGAISREAAALYRGVKVTKEGLEVRLEDKQAALTKVGQHLGMFVERRIQADASLEEFLARLDGAGGAPGEPGPSEG